MTDRSRALQIKDRVRKRTGYRFPGRISSVFRILDENGDPTGPMRVVVQCTAPDVKNCLHIFAPEQLELVDEV
ncbi:MAG: hypothetical protein P4L82_16760 [Ancalomicrobiaceae bacterium]|nr:hypothetical protein [Ancalomicrobiaceae bacterium]